MGCLMRELKIFSTSVGVFLLAYFLPLSSPKIQSGILEAFRMLQWYARNHTLTCVVPALFIAGAITTFLSKEAVLRHLGPRARKAEAYSVASISGTVLAVCSCSVLPMFTGIYRVGAGLGPATAFLYSGPALNILAIFLTARVLGFQLGVWRAVGAIVFGIILGLIMALVFRRDERVREDAIMQLPESRRPKRKLWQTAVYFTAMVAFLVFSDWYNPGNVTISLVDGTHFSARLLQETQDNVVVRIDQVTAQMKVGERLTLSKSKILSMDQTDSWVMDVYHAKLYLAALMGLIVLWMVCHWFENDEIREWMKNTWVFTKLLVPLLFGGVFVVGFLSQLLPDHQIASWVGDNGILSILIASVLGCLFYFATLTEIPILQALIEHGMAQGPALALLLAGPALSLPSILVIRSVLGMKKTAVFTSLVIIMATTAGLIYGLLSEGGVL
jgi:uncharacterized membrane protein YraQ (UPF0718 family)